jgi:hypothetical protein
MGRERDGKLSRTLIRCNLAKVSEDSRPIGLPRPIHVGIFYWALSRDLMGWPPQLHGAPGVKQQLAAVRMLFDWRITGQIVPANPAAAVRGPKHNAISVPVSFGFGADALGTNLFTLGHRAARTRSASIRSKIGWFLRLAGGGDLDQQSVVGGRVLPQGRQRIFSCLHHTSSGGLSEVRRTRGNQRYGLLDAPVRILLDVVVAAGLHIADRRGKEEFAPPRLLLHRLDRVHRNTESHLAHLALHAEQQLVIGRGRVVAAVLVDKPSIPSAAQLSRS